MNRTLEIGVSRHRAAITIFLLSAWTASGWSMTDAGATSSGVGSWHPTRSLLTVGGDERVVALTNGRVFVVRSEDEGITPTNPTPAEALASELYEPASGTWAPGPTPPAHNASTIVPLADGGALLIGEAACAIPSLKCLPTSAAYRLNSSDSVWTPSAPMHEARARPTVVPLANGSVLVAGGFGDDCTPRVAFGYSCAPLASAEIFDPTTGAWSQAAPMPESRGGASATLLSDGSVLLVGSSNTKIENALRYYPTSGQWQTLGAAPQLTGTKLIALPGDRAIAIGFDPEADFYGSLGGADKRRQIICQSIAADIYTAAKDAWSTAPPLPEPIDCSTDATALSTGQILYSASGTRYVLDVHQRCWIATGPSVNKEHDGYVVALPGGQTLDLGGTSAKGEPSTTVETYMSGPQTCTVAQRLQARIFEHLAPRGRATRVTTALKTGYSFSLDAPLPGRLRVDWYFQREEGEGSPGPVLIATGRAATRRGGQIKLTIKVLPTARALLERPLRFQLTAKALFRARDGQIVSATSPLTLNR